MSLLMDALKRAEQAKRQSEAAGSAAPAAAATGTDSAKRSSGLPELPSRLELLDDELSQPRAARSDPDKAAGPAGSEEARRREAAQNLFEVKQAPSRRPFYLTVGLLTAVAVAGIGVYFWIQLKPVSGLALAPAAGLRPGAAAPAPNSPRAATTPAPGTPPAGEPPQPTAAATPQPQPAPAPRAESPPRRPAPAPDAAPAARPAPGPDSDSPIRVTTGRLRVNPALNRAYQAFETGDLAAARRSYDEVLKAEPKNVDALLGLAAIATQQGRPDLAEGYFLQAVEADPRDGAAQAGLIALRGQTDPIQSESRIKTLLAAQPDSAPLNFTLGNLYARQGRWQEAQQAYFRAYAGEGDNPDYAFNLAVSLDQLRQPKLALQYYQGALAAAAHRPAGFDKSQAASRIRDLQQ